MAAEFGAGITEATELPVNTRPQAGVSSPPVALQGLTDIFSQVGEMAGKLKEKKQQTFLSSFAEKQLLIAEGLAQGSKGIKSSAHAQTLMRRNLLDAMDANPMLTNDLIKLQASLTGLTGGAKIVADGTKEEQRRIAHEDQLVKAGLLQVGATDAEYQSAAEAERLAVASAERYKTRMQTLEMESKQLSLTSARRSEIEAQKKAETNRFVADNSHAEFTVVRNKFDEILAGEGTEAEKVNAIKQYYTEWQAATAATLGNVDSGMRDALKSSFDNLEKHYIDLATGAIGDAEVERRTKRTMTAMEAIALSDPDIARLAVTSKLFGEAGLVKVMSSTNSKKAQDAFFRFLSADGEQGPDMETLFTTEKDSVIGQRGGLDATLEGLTTGDEETQEEATKKMNQVMNLLEDESGKISRDPLKAKAVVDWIASPNFLKAIRANPEAFGNIEGVQDVLDQNYHDEVAGLIRREFKENNVAVTVPGQSMKETGQLATKQVPAGSLVQAVGTESGMTFEPIDPNNAEARAKAASLNKKLKPIINTTIKAQAHLAGRSDYKAIWEESSQTIMGGQGSEQVPGGDEGDDLEIEDFVFPKVSTGGLPESVANDEPFLASVEELSSKYDIEPEILLAVMDFETGGSFNPAQKNAAGSSGTGLIQFMAKTAKGLGTSVEKLANLDRLGQMKYVEKYLDQFANKIKGGKAQDVYMAVLFPKAIDKPDDYVLFREGTLAYRQNKGLDKSGDGTVTKAEAAAKVVSLVGKHKGRKK